MENYMRFLNKMPLSHADTCICNYLLIDRFDPKCNHIETIYYSLKEIYGDDVVAYELIVCGLYAIDVRIHHRSQPCCKTIYDKHKDKLKEEKLFYIQIYRDCTDDELVKFIKFIYNRQQERIDCARFFEIVSAAALPFDETHRDNVAEFRSRFCGGDWQMDGKRPRLAHSPDDSAERFAKLSLNKYYSIKENRNNFCLIFNDCSRDGSDKDVEKIKDTFGKISGFTVKSEEIKTKKKLMEDIKKYCRLNSEDSDMIVCFFMSHGVDRILYAHGEERVHHECIEELFSAIKAPTLVGKPKILIFQSCRGKGLQEVIQLDSPPLVSVTQNVVQSKNQLKEKTVNICDFFTIYSTIAGTASLRCPETGSYFIQQFCSLIKEHSKNKSIDEMCTMLNRDYIELDFNGIAVTQLCQVNKLLRRDNIYLEKPNFRDSY